MSVDLPEPEAPISATISPGAMTRLTSLSASFLPKRLESLSTMTAVTSHHPAAVIVVRYGYPRSLTVPSRFRDALTTPTGDAEVSLQPLAPAGICGDTLVERQERPAVDIGAGQGGI